MTYLLVFTSTFFITNVLVGLYMGHILYAALFFILTCTSSLHHSSLLSSDHLARLDRGTCIAVAMYGAYMIYNKELFHTLSLSNVMILLCFMICVAFYEYGGRTQSFCFDPRPYVALFYHACMHLFGSVGHHFIMLHA
jgi:hypothetical protein